MWPAMGVYRREEPNDLEVRENFLGELGSGTQVGSEAMEDNLFDSSWKKRGLSR